MLLQALCYCVSFHSRLWNQNEVTVWKHQIWLKIGDFFVPCDIKIWQMTLNKANLRDLIAATSLVIFSVHVTFKFDRWPRKTIGHLFCTTSSFVHHLKPIGESKLQFYYSPDWVKIGNFLSCVTLKFDGWLGQTIGHLFYATSSFVNHFKAIG